MKADLDWKTAILKVLEQQSEPISHHEIARLIQENGYRSKLGYTPQNTITSVISTSLSQGNSPFVRVGPGLYALAASTSTSETRPSQTSPECLQGQNGPGAEPTEVIGALGMFWERDQILWEKPRLLGLQQIGANTVDFSEEIGIYLLHDSQGVVYVGRATDQSILKRLKQHNYDRHKGRWSRFSWFGAYPVEEDGSLDKRHEVNFGIQAIMITLEAVLIEAIEPRQNRRRGDGLDKSEFLQFEDPEIRKKREAEIVHKLLQRGI